MRRAAYIAVWLFVMVIPLDRMFLDELLGIAVPITITQVVGVFTLLVVITATLFEGRLRRFDRSHLYVYLFIVWACLSTLWSQDPDSALGRAITYVQLALMVWIMTQYGQSRDEQKGLMLAYVCGSTIVAVQLLVGFALGGTVFSVELFPGRFTSMGYNPNDLALSLAIGIPFAWYCLNSMRGVSALIGLVYLPVAAAAILLSASRGGMLAAGFGLILVPLGFSKMTHLRKLAIIGSVVVAVSVAVIVVPERSWERLITIDDKATTRWAVGNLENLDLMNMRVAIWKEGLDQFSEHPFVGVGAGGYLNVVDPVHGERRVAHNIFLSILVELGLVGLMLFVVMMGVLLASTRHLPADERLTWIVVLGTYLIGGLFLSWEHTKQTWMIVGLLAARFAVVRGARTPKRQAIPDETRAVIARHIERQSWEKARQTVIDVLLDRGEITRDDKIEALFERLSELNDEWPDPISVVIYFEDRLQSVPETVAEWYDLAEEWSEKLRRLVVSDF